jgi:hypothetical protein
MRMRFRTLFGILGAGFGIVGLIGALAHGGGWGWPLWGTLWPIAYIIVTIQGNPGSHNDH